MAPLFRRFAQPFYPFFEPEHPIDRFGNKPSVMGAEIFARTKKSIDRAVGRMLTGNDKAVRFDGMADE